MPSDPNNLFEIHQNAFKAVLKQNLTIARQVRGLTQDELSSASGVSRTTIIQLENAEGDPKLTTVVNLAIALGIAPVLLLFGSDEMMAVQQLLENPPSPDQVAEAQVKTMGQLLKRGFSRPSRSPDSGAATAGGPLGGAAIGAAVGSMLLPGMGTSIGAMLGTILERGNEPAVPRPAAPLTPAIDPQELVRATGDLSVKSPQMKMRMEMLRLSRNENRPTEEIARSYGLTVDQVDTHLRIALTKFYEWKKKSGSDVNGKGDRP